MTGRYTAWMAHFVILLTIVTSCNTDRGGSFNGGFESVDYQKQPLGWQYFGDNAYSFAIDSSVHKSGRYSLSISGFDNLSTFLGSAIFTIPAPVSGDTLVLSAYVKVQNVTGSATLAIKVLGYDGQPIGSTVKSSEITGTDGWTKYAIKAPYNSSNALTITGGVLLNGNGRIWVDDFQLTVNGKSIEDLDLKKIAGNKSKNKDAERASLVLSKTSTAGEVKLLANVGMLWGFLKYYHPAVVKGNYDWDRALFRILPKIMNASSLQGSYEAMEQWVDELGRVPENPDRKMIPAATVKLQPDFGFLFSNNNLPESLIEKLEFIRSNYRAYPDQHYVSLADLKNPVFTHEVHYNVGPYPNAALRLLALFRYWNTIQYFYPYRYLIMEDWDSVLCKFIPRFLTAKNKFDYTRDCLELIGSLHDGHANIWGRNLTLDTLKGVRITPLKAAFIKDKLVVSGYYTDSAKRDSEVNPGDIIEKIDGIEVDSLVKKYLPLTPASNYAGQLYRLSSPNGFLFRTNLGKMELEIRSQTSEHRVILNTVPLHSIQFRNDTSVLHNKGFQLINNNIGYIYPAKLGPDDIDSIKVLFRRTKGIVVDLRCYPSTFMPYVYGSWLKPNSSPFALFTCCSLAEPGAVVYEKSVSNGGPAAGMPQSLLHSSNRVNPSMHARYYQGKLVILVDQTTYSQAEFTTMALSTVPGSIVLGGTTAGADGDVSFIFLPGGIWTMMSGKGIYYPDSSETQQVGVKVDEYREPDMQDVKNNRDPLLNRAIDIIDSRR